jgi:hypothetical protein
VKTLLAALFLISALSISSFAQIQSEYSVEAIKGPYFIIGQKPYKKLADCANIKVADKVTFTSDPITCLQTEILDLLTLSKCPVECLTNEDLPPEYQ